MKKEIEVNPALVAYCGLYCGACPSYRRGRCPGCHENVKAGWCKIKACCEENTFATCASCTKFTDIMECGKFNNLFAKVIGFVLNSDRRACVAQIKEVGLPEHAARMARLGRVSMKRGRTAEK